MVVGETDENHSSVLVKNPVSFYQTLWGAVEPSGHRLLRRDDKANTDDVYRAIIWDFLQHSLPDVGLFKYVAVRGENPYASGRRTPYSASDGTYRMSYDETTLWAYEWWPLAVHGKNAVILNEDWIQSRHTNNERWMLRSTVPKGESLFRVSFSALKNAGVKPEDVTLIDTLNGNPCLFRSGERYFLQTVSRPQRYTLSDVVEELPRKCRRVEEHGLEEGRFGSRVFTPDVGYRPEKAEVQHFGRFHSEQRATSFTKTHVRGIISHPAFGTLHLPKGIWHKVTKSRALGVWYGKRY